MQKSYDLKKMVPTNPHGISHSPFKTGKEKRNDKSLGTQHDDFILTNAIGVAKIFKNTFLNQYQPFSMSISAIQYV